MDVKEVGLKRLREEYVGVFGIISIDLDDNGFLVKHTQYISEQQRGSLKATAKTVSGIDKIRYEWIAG